ncbi:PucR family transcriptional regulator [Microtetraspora malaysiensis]|uniref:PucR family transcriptional regulator n=1 Tax=Microtetraspora malaysiensis TaxID=161358 RepID=UPI003D92E6B3
MRRLVTALSSAEALIERTVRDVRADVPAYEAVPTASVIASVERNRALASRVLAEGVVPPSRDIWEAELSTSERLHQGVEIQDIMGGFRVVIACIQGWVVDNASAHGVDATETLRLSQLLWRLSDAFSARAAMTYRQEGIAGALADEQRRAQWVLGLLAGTLEPPQLQEGCARYGLSRDTRFHAVCTQQLPDSDLARVREELTRSATPNAYGPHRRAAILVPAEGRLVGLAATPPVGSTVVVAVGPAAEVEELPSSFAVAEQVLMAAGLYTDRGVHTVETVTWRIAVPVHREVSEVLLARYIEPLREQGPFGELVLDALDAWLGHARSIPRAAASIPVHVNTLRYRLARFEKLVGCSLEDTDTILELSWALLARKTAS